MPPPSQAKADARYAEHVEAMRALAARILAATEGDRLAPHADDAASIHWAHVGDAGHWREALQDVSDSMFREGEYARGAQ